jgi:hypothetical protein
MQRKVIGEPKYGLVVRIDQTPLTMSLTAAPEPLLLYFVAGAAVVVGVVGSFASSPQTGLAGFLAFAILFSPLICLLAVTVARIRTRCVLDKESGQLRIEEQSYARRVQETYPLEEVTAVVFRRVPGAPFAGSAALYGVFLKMLDADYLAACGNDEKTVGQDAWRLSRFLGVPLETPPTGARPERPAAGGRLVLTTAMLYMMILALSVAALFLVFDQLPGVNRAFAGFLGAVVISEIGAMLAYAYYRSQHPYEI